MYFEPWFFLIYARVKARRENVEDYHTISLKVHPHRLLVGMLVDLKDNLCHITTIIGASTLSDSVYILFVSESAEASYLFLIETLPRYERVIRYKVR